VQFPIVCGKSAGSRPFAEIWRDAPQFHEVRSIRAREPDHLFRVCGHVGTCSRCPGLAYMEGRYMRGPSTAEIAKKSFYRTGIASENMKRRGLTAPPPAGLVQIGLRPH